MGSADFHLSLGDAEERFFPVVSRAANSTCPFTRTGLLAAPTRAIVHVVQNASPYGASGGNRCETPCRQEMRDRAMEGFVSMTVEEQGALLGTARV